MAIGVDKDLLEIEINCLLETVKRFKQDESSNDFNDFARGYSKGRKSMADFLEWQITQMRDRLMGVENEAT